MNWLSITISKYPGIILGVITVLCIFSTYFSFNDRKLPSFEDPQLGFETRGTEISKRLVTWDKLLEESGPYGSLVFNPDDLSSKSVRPVSKRLASERSNTKIILPEHHVIDDDKEEEVEKNKEKKKWEQLKQIQFPERNDDSLNEQFEQIYRMNYDPDFFCDTIQPDYAQLVFSSKPNHNIFSYEALMDLCDYQSKIESITNYMRHCITSNSGNCCNIWSLPNYIAWIIKLPTCKHITPKSVNSTLKLLTDCSKFYHEGKLSPRYTGKDVPRSCRQNHNVYNIIQYIVDIDFLPSMDSNNLLKDTSIYLPVPKSSGSLQLYHDIESVSFSSDVIKLSAIDIGVKYMLFDEYLVNDTRYLLLGTIFIVLCVWIYTGCILITILTITAILFSLINAYFMYTIVLGLKFFPFMNILAVIVSLGIGSDDAYIICKVWDRTKRENSHLSKSDLVRLVIKHSAVAVFVTTLTTVAAFLSSYWSSVTAVRCFR